MSLEMKIFWTVMGVGYVLIMSFIAVVLIVRAIKSKSLIFKVNKKLLTIGLILIVTGFIHSYRTLNIEKPIIPSNIPVELFKESIVSGQLSDGLIAYKSEPIKVRVNYGIGKVASMIGKNIGTLPILLDRKIGKYEQLSPFMPQY